MKKMMKKSLAIITCSLAFLPLIACGNDTVEAKAYTPTQTITAVEIDVENANITLVATDSETKVDYGETEKIQLRVAEAGGILRITQKDLPFYKEMFQGTDVVDIVVYAPKTLAYLTAETDRGFVKCEGFTVDGEIELSSERGKVTATDITARRADLSSERGDLVVTRIDVSSSLELSSERGNITASIRGSQADFRTEVEKERGSSNISSTSVGSKRLEIDVERGDAEITFYE